MSEFSIQSTFIPPAYLRNPHIQTILSSLKIRTLGQKQLGLDARQILIDAGEGVRLLGFYTGQRSGTARGLVILLHGWEGSSESTYILTTGGFLYRRGYDIFRLNFRDHGESHHLNEGLFNSGLIEEVHRAVQNIATSNQNLPLFIVGFSLGGNFALRMALRHKQHPIRNLRQVVAISPLLDPAKTTEALDRGFRLYRSYFAKKWKKSLKKKQLLFPHRYEFRDLMNCPSLLEITERILPRYSPYQTSQEYFNTYTLTGLPFGDLSTPVLALTAADDPMIPVQDFHKLQDSQHLQIHVERYGGHCGFLQNYRLQSWVEELLERTFLDCV